MTETGREQDIKYMEQLEQVIAERDRLREALIEQAKLTAYEALVGTGVTAGFARSEWEDWLCPEARAALQEGNDE